MPTLISRCTWLSWSSCQTASGVTPRPYPCGQLSPAFIKILLLFPKLRAAAVLADGQLPAGSDAVGHRPLRTSRRSLCILFFSCVHLQHYRHVCAEQCWRADEDYYIAGVGFFFFLLLLYLKKQHKIAYINGNICYGSLAQANYCFRKSSQILV